MTESLLILVPARGGSKRLPGKNLRLLAGRSLIARTADAVADAGIDAPVVLSTDDNAIAAEGRRAGMRVPFLRPADLASDIATSVDVTLHALDWFAAEMGADPDLLMLLQPTSPLRGSKCLTVALEMLAHRPDAGCVVAMSAIHLPPSALFLADGTGQATALSDDDRRPVYMPNGALYLTRTAQLRALHTLYAPPILPLVMDQRRAVDIDTPADWAIAEALLAAGLPEQKDAIQSDTATPPGSCATA